MADRRAFIKSVSALAGLTICPGLASLPAMAQSDRSHCWVPEESQPHLRTFMQWPVNRAVHPDPVFLKMLQHTIAGIANSIAEFEPVVMLMDRQYEKAARRKLSGAVEIWDIATDDLWCRDSGPLFVRNEAGQLGVSLLNFNGWGNKQVHKNDGQIARKVAERLNLPVYDNGLVGEAGGVESDGAGTLIAHESSWINANRNSGSKAQVSAQLLEAIGAEKILWAPGVAGADITDYHIDSLARFSEVGTVLIQMPEEIDPDDPWSVAAFETYDMLAEARDVRGDKLSLVVVPEPYDTRITSADFVASYVNYYVCNGAVISAQFGDQRADRQAQEILADLYPGREIISLNIDSVGEVGGGIHCATQQQPAL